MDSIIAIEIAKKNAERLGNLSYYLDTMPIVLPANTTKKIEGGRDYFYMIGTPTNIEIESSFAKFSTVLTAPANDYEINYDIFEGDLTIVNLDVANPNRSLYLLRQIFIDKSTENDTTINLKIKN